MKFYQWQNIHVSWFFTECLTVLCGCSSGTSNEWDKIRAAACLNEYYASDYSQLYWPVWPNLWLGMDCFNDTKFFWFSNIFVSQPPRLASTRPRPTSDFLLQRTELPPPRAADYYHKDIFLLEASIAAAWSFQRCWNYVCTVLFYVNTFMCFGIYTPNCTGVIHNMCLYGIFIFMFVIKFLYLLDVFSYTASWLDCQRVWSFLWIL